MDNQRSLTLTVAESQTLRRMADAAVWYVEHGLAIYPARGKTRIKGFTSDSAIHDARRARKCFEVEHPDANIGIVPGHSDLAILDCDERNGGRKTWDKLCDEIGCEWFRGCPVVLTPSDGFHLYFRANGACVPGGSNALGPGLDVLIGNSGVIVPPSTRSDGEYRWVWEFSDPFNPPPFPSILLERTAAKDPDRKPKPKLPLKMPSVIPEGQRNDCLASVAGKLLRSMGPLSEEELFGHLRVVNEMRCRPPLPDSEVRTVAHSIISYGGPSVDPWRWLEAAQSRLTTPGELRTAIALAALAARCGRSKVTPAALYVCRGWGIPRTTYFQSRKGIEQKGCIHITDQRPDAPLIELAAEIVHHAP